MSSRRIKVLLIPLFGKEGQGEILQEYFKIPVYPLLPKGDKRTQRRITNLFVSLY
jgi:hypothetical protein